jgi:ribosomal protein L40E
MSKIMEVDAEKPLPAICLKCGAKKHIVRRNEKLTAASASQGLGAIGGVCGVMVARAMKDDPVAGAFVLVTTFAGVIVVGLVVHAYTPKVNLALPLCRDCNAKWSTGLTARYAVIALLVAACVMALYGFFTHDTVGYVAGGVVMAVGVAVSLAFRLRDRFVFASEIRGTQATLKGVSGDARMAIEMRAARIKKREG